MDLGQKIKAARLEAGLSQRQLCGEVITRNMLSLIENGSAKPSMDTLRYLSGRLGKSISFFLEEKEEVSPNQPVMEGAREAHAKGDWKEAAEILKAYRSPDPIYDREKGMLWAEVTLHLARQAMAEGKEGYAREWLEAARGAAPYFAEEVERRRLLLLGQLPGESVSHQLPSLDEELLLRAREALHRGDPVRAGNLLRGVETQNSPWHLLMGKSHLAMKNYKTAAHHLHKAEGDYPKETARALEIAYRELGNFRKAYEYACKGRE